MFPSVFLVLGVTLQLWAHCRLVSFNQFFRVGVTLHMFSLVDVCKCVRLCVSMIKIAFIIARRERMQSFRLELSLFSFHLKSLYGVM